MHELGTTHTIMNDITIGLHNIVVEVSIRMLILIKVILTFKVFYGLCIEEISKIINARCEGVKTKRVVCIL